MRRLLTPVLTVALAVPCVPAAETAPEPDPAKPAIEKTGGTTYRLGDIRFDTASRTATFPAKVNMDEGIVEYAIVHESGKVHESLLSTQIRPFDLNVVLLLLNWKPCDGFFERPDPQSAFMPAKDPEIRPESLARFSISWKEKDGKTATVPLESWLLNIEERRAVPDGPFVYTGSITDRSGFLAQETGSILAVYCDPAAMFNNPREGNISDEIWAVHKGRVPERETAVTVTIQAVPASGKAEKPAPPAKRKEISPKPKP